jgi:stage II sporulation protein M
MPQKKIRKLERKSKEIFFDRVFNNFNLAFNDIKNIKYFILFATLLFLFSAVFGYLFPKLFEEQVLKLIKEIIMKTQELGTIELITYIMYNNIQTAFLGMIMGIFFAIVPIATLAVNGYVLGFVANKSIAIEGVTVLWKLVPHGIFEIPAIMISIALGIRLGIFPFYVKDKLKAILSVIIMIASFIFFFSIIVMILNLSYYLNNNELPNQDTLDKMMVDFSSNGLGLIFYVIIFFIFYVLSISIGITVLNKTDKKIVIEKIKGSIRIFVFVIIPLLILAGIIEGFLIRLLG